MKFIKAKQVKVVAATTPEEFEEKMNAAYLEIAELGAQVETTFNINAGHCCYLTYSFSKEIPETLEDEFKIKGKLMHCRQCPHFVPPTDRRQKYVKCTYGGLCSIDHPACEYFYRQVLQGEVVPIE